MSKNFHEGQIKHKEPSGSRLVYFPKVGPYHICMRPPFGWATKEDDSVNFQKFNPHVLSMNFQKACLIECVYKIVFFTYDKSL